VFSCWEYPCCTFPRPLNSPLVVVFSCHSHPVFTSVHYTITASHTHWHWLHPHPVSPVCARLPTSSAGDSDNRQEPGVEQISARTAIIDIPSCECWMKFSFLVCEMKPSDVQLLSESITMWKTRITAFLLSPFSLCLALVFLTWRLC